MTLFLYMVCTRHRTHITYCAGTPTHLLLHAAQCQLCVFASGRPSSCRLAAQRGSCRVSSELLLLLLCVCPVRCASQKTVETTCTVGQLFQSFLLRAALKAAKSINVGESFAHVLRAVRLKSLITAIMSCLIPEMKTAETMCVHGN